MRDNYEEKLMQDQGLYAVAMPLIVPALEKRKKSILSRALSRYHAGETNFLPDIAALAVITDLENEFRVATSQINGIEEREYNESTRK